MKNVYSIVYVHMCVCMTPWVLSREYSHLLHSVPRIGDWPVKDKVEDDWMYVPGTVWVLMLPPVGYW